MESPVEKIEFLKEQLGSSDEETRRLAVAGLVAASRHGSKGLSVRSARGCGLAVRKEAVEALLAA